MFDKLMAKAIPPRLGLDAITANTTERLGHKIEAYTADLYLSENKVDLLVTHPEAFFLPEKYRNETRQHKYWLTEGPEMIKLLKFKAEEMTAEQGSKGELVHIRIEYKGQKEPYILTFFVKELNGEKVKIVKEIK